MVLLTPAWAEAAQGVLTHEIVLGTHLDLTGPLASQGRAAQAALQMAVDEVNAAGGVQGRRIRLLVRDDRYEPARAIDVVKDLVQANRVFAIVSPLGTPTAQAAMMQALDRRVPYLFPLSAESGVQPFHPLRFTIQPSDAAATRHGLRLLLDRRGPLAVGALVSFDDFGKTLIEGVQAELTERGQTLVASASYRRDGDPEMALRQLRDAGAELVVLGSVADDIPPIVNAARALRWSPLFLCSFACYTPETPVLGGAASEGLFAPAILPMPYPGDPKLDNWVRRYERRNDGGASPVALAAYRNMRLFLDALAKAGPEPDQAKLSRALEAMDNWTLPEIDAPPIDFTVTDHVGTHTVFLAQIRDGRWARVPDPVPTLRRIKD